MGAIVEAVPGKGEALKEKRKIKRRYLLYYMRVYDETRQQIGNLVDLTPKGAMLVSEHPLPIKTNYQLKLELSEDVADKPYLEFNARSLWCRPDVDPHFYNTGFRILDLSPDDVKIVNRIIEVYGFRDN
jgi:hypothetical protein